MQYYSFYCIFDQINAALVSMSYFIKKENNKKVCSIQYVDC